MNAHLRSALTLLGLLLIVAVASVWGWGALTTPFPKNEEVPVCTDTAVTAGTEIRREQVVVSILNGSGRNGLASATSELLAERGFVKGDISNAKSFPTTQIWTDDPNNPAVQLVRRQFNKAKVVTGKQDGIGVVIVLGEKFTTLRKKQIESFRAKEDSTFCMATDSE